MKLFYDKLVYPEDFPIVENISQVPEDLSEDEEVFTLETLPAEEKSLEAMILEDFKLEQEESSICEELETGPIDAAIINKEIFKKLQNCSLENFTDSEIGKYVDAKHMQVWFPIDEIRGMDFWVLENGNGDYNSEYGKKVAVALAMCMGFNPASRDCQDC